MDDLLIVGRGLAAAVLAHTCHQSGISFRMIGDPALSSCSRVAAGIWNPVVFKRMTESWMAPALIDSLNAFYTRCEQTLGVRLLAQREIMKPFGSPEEERLWLSKAHNQLADFLDGAVSRSLPAGVSGLASPLPYGRVLRGGTLDVARFLSATEAFFSDRCVTARFVHSRLQITAEGVSYDNLTAKRIVFCEGHLVRFNPYFSWIPMKPAKGELLTVRAPELSLQGRIFSRNGYLVDIGGGDFRLGATYAWDDTTDDPTNAGLAVLTERAKAMIAVPFRVQDHSAGVRPATIDRRPAIGSHPHHPNVCIFNGLGAKGVMLAPWFAGKFVLFSSQRVPLPAEADIKRFYHLYV